MNLSTWSIRNPVPTLMLFLVFSLAGMASFQTLSIQDLPDIDLPTVNVSLGQPGASPSQLETEIARKVEDSLSTISGVKHIYTTIENGVVNLAVVFILGKNLSDALSDVKEGVDRIRLSLPRDMEQPSFSVLTVSGAPLQSFAVSSSQMNEEALSWFVDDVVSRTILAIPGVGKFERVGGVQREVHIDIDPANLAGLGVTAGAISQALKLMQQDSSGGRGQVGFVEQSVRTVVAVSQAAELGAIQINIADGHHQVRLDQIAVVSDTLAERNQVALLDGRHVVGFQIYRAKGYDETKTDKDVHAALEQLRTRIAGLQVTSVSNLVNHTREQYYGSMSMLYEGALLAVLVVWWFLRDWRATLVAAAALPLSIFPTFAAMRYFGFSLNKLTLLALAVIVGVLVDDAIVEIENIARHVRMGKPPMQAAEDAVKEMTLPVVATTLTLVAVFLPTATMAGVSGLFFRQFGWTAVIAVLASLLIARLLTPMMAAYLLKNEHKHVIHDSRPVRWYLSQVKACLDYPKTTMLATLIFLVLSLALVPLLPKGFVPTTDTGLTKINFELAPGSRLVSSMAVAESARLSITKIPGIRHVFTTIGDPPEAGGGAETGEVRKGSLTLILAPREERAAQKIIESKVRKTLMNVAGARFTVDNGDNEQSMMLILASDNSNALESSSQALERDLRSISGVSNISSDASLERPEIVIRPDIARTTERGVDAAAIGETVRIATSGDFAASLPKLNLDDRQIYIRVRVPDAARQNLDIIGNLRVPSRTGLVPINSIANLSIESGPVQIKRYDRRRYVSVTADLGGISLDDALNTANALPAIRKLPDNVKLIEVGNAELMAELFTDFGWALLIGALCVYCVLVLLFKDFFQPITILTALPLSLGGALIALLITKNQLNLPSLVGLVMLMGIVSKNSILLVEYTNVGIQEHGMNQLDALIEACHMRVRPIVMTSVAMIAGMLPIAFGLGADASFRQPMAITAIGGLITSTVLSLLVVPVIYRYVAKISPQYGLRVK